MTNFDKLLFEVTFKENARTFSKISITQENIRISRLRKGLRKIKYLYYKNTNTYKKMHIPKRKFPTRN